MIDITSILISLCPESNWATDGDKIIWEDEINKQPTDEEIEIERQRLTKLIPIKKLRKERNRLLQQTDVFVLLLSFCDIPLYYNIILFSA